MEALPELSVLLLLLGAALLAGFIDAIAGGGGLITLPALLSVGVPPHLALGTNKMAGTFGTFSSARVYIAKGIFKPRHWRACIVATFIGAMAGALATRLFSADALGKVLPLLILLAAVYVMLPKKHRLEGVGDDFKPSLPSSVGLGTTLGFYDGFSGPGAGAFWLSLAMKIYRVDILRAAGIARSMNFVSNIVSLFTFMLLGTVSYSIGLAMGLCLMVGATIGAHSAIHYGQRLIKPMFIAVVIALAARLMWLEWFAGG